VIVVSHLTRVFGSLVALDDVTLAIERGEVVGVLGPNGAGKTTMLRILAGYLPASSGSARIGGFDVLRESLEVRRRIGYLPESVPLYREHRVVEMLEFQGRLHALTRDERRRRIPEVLERVGLADRSRDLIGGLSRGLRQRVGLAVALLPEPEVLILDEPTSGLDPLQRIEVRGIIRDLAQRHTILLSSHILPEVEAVCPRVVILHRGRIAADGTREELVTKLARSSHVRLEAVIGADVESARRLLKCIPGVRDVVDRGRRGIHHDLDIECDQDLREEVGALAAQRGWALRELSWRRPTLEEIFARIALSLGDDAAQATGREDDAGHATGGGTGTSAAAQRVSSDAGPTRDASSSGPPAREHPASTIVALAANERASQSPSSREAPANAPRSRPASGGEGDAARVAESSATHARADPRAVDEGNSTAPASNAPKRVVYNLNPFDMGATRDLGKPKAVASASPLVDLALRGGPSAASVERADEPDATSSDADALDERRGESEPRA